MPTKNLLTKEMRSEWHPKDPEWLAARQQQWQRIENYINHTSWFTKGERKQLQEYFFKGKLTYDEGFSVDISLQLAWHPKKDLEVWHRHFNWVFSQIPADVHPDDVRKELYEGFSQMGSWIILTRDGFQSGNNRP